MKRLNEAPPLTDSQLDEIIDAPRIELRINKEELLEYFETVNGKFEPSWMFMDRARMKEIFQFCLLRNWCTSYHQELIQSALNRMV